MAVRAAPALLFALAAAPAAGQPATGPFAGPELVRSMGQPPVLKPYLASPMTWNKWDGSRLGVVGIAGVYRDLMLPVSGGFGVSVEGYGGASGDSWDAGRRVLATSRLLFLNVGVDWNAQAGNAHEEWIFFNTNAFNDENGSTHSRAMEKLRAELGRVQALFRQTDAAHPQGRSYALEAVHYHEALRRAFEAVVGSVAAAEVTGRAREVLLEQVLLPYDRLIGQFKHPDALRGLEARALDAFGAGLGAMSALDPDRRAGAVAVFECLLRDVEEGRRRLLAHWDGDERNIWLPLDPALRPDEHDSQEELDAVVERAVDRRFSRGDVIYPTNASRFHIELIRSLEKAQDYHVLWVHDFAGRLDGRPDPVAFEVAVDGYLRTLARHVREYDRTGRLPVFLVFHTQFFYDGGGGRLFLSLLEDPLGHELRLGDEYKNMEARARAAQEDLRRAVAGSRRLQEEAQRYGRAWLRRVVKVHVSVTFPADLSFRSKQVLEGLRFAPDSLMLDHRKLFFYDVTEEAGSKNQDPRGASLDGETSYVVAGPWTLYLYSDFLFLMAATTWLEDEGQLARLIPVEKERHRKMGRFMEKIL